MLDRVAPGWAYKVNPQTLDLYSNARCILGQVYGSYCMGLGHLESQGVITWKARQSPFIDFNDDKTYQWLVEVMDRRAPVGDLALQEELVAA